MERHADSAGWYIAPSGWALLQLLLAAVAVTAALAVGVARFDPAQLVPQLMRVLVALSCVMVLRTRIDLSQSVWWSRLAAVLGGIAFLETGWVLVRLLNHLTMASAFALADQRLAGMDAMLGLDWHAWFDLVAAHGWLRELLGASYTSLTIFSVMAFLATTLCADARRGRYFLETFLATALLCTIWGAFLPAFGAVAHYLGTGADLTLFSVEPGLYAVDAMERLRSGTAVVLKLKSLPGLVTFPSFHTAAAVLLAGAAWRSRLFLPALAYALLVIAATPVFGGHYFVDLIAGAALALAVLAGYAALPRYRGLFTAGRPAGVTGLAPLQSR